MDINAILFVFGSFFTLIVGSTTWLLFQVSNMSGDVKVIKFQVNQHTNVLKTLTEKG